MVGGRDYGQSQYNRTYQSKRPAGTAFTPFVFAAAFSKESSRVRWPMIRPWTTVK